MKTTLQHLLAGGSFAAVLALANSPPAGALDNAKQLLTGGTSQTQGVDNGGTSRTYMAPGHQNAYGLDFPGTGEGPLAGSVRMPSGGKLSKLRVQVVTTNTPASGIFTLTVFKNGLATNMKCSVSGQGTCNNNITVTLAAGDRLGVEAMNTFNGSGILTFSFAMLLD